MRKRMPLAGWAYLSALWLPLWCLGFLLTSPHPALEAMLWLLPMGLPVAADFLGLEVIDLKPMPEVAWLAWLPVALAGLFLATTLGLLLTSRSLSFAPDAWLDTLATLVVVKFLFGSNAAVCGLVTAHELIHRKSAFLRALGRAILIVCCYEHFFTEHLRGHHRHAGSPQDPATARLGESYREFWRRTVPAQFRSAWRLECRRLRLGAEFSLRWLRHRVLQGLIVELGLLATIGLWLGPIPLLAFAVQALMAVRNLEAINYVQHFGLAEVPWRTETWCSTYLLLGLARHAHHHRCPNLPYYRLETFQDAPRLPYGYFALMFVVAYANRAFQKAVLAELKRLNPGARPKEERI